MEEVYRDKILFRAVGAYMKEKDEKTYKQTQLDHFYEELLDCGLPEDSPRPTNWREAFRQSKQHTKTHSIQLVMVTTSRTTHNEHAKDVNQQVTLDDLFGSV